MTFTGEASVRTVDAERWVLLEPLRYPPYEVPAGYVTDFASTPRATSWIVPKTGLHTRPSILHDWLLTDGMISGVVTSAQADRIFLEAMLGVGVEPVRAHLMWTGVRWAALFSRARRGGWWRAAPAVLGWSLLALPIVAVSSVNLLGMAYYHLLALAGGRPPSRRSLST